MKTAILVDGGFYRRRAQSRLGEKTAEERADELNKYCHMHLHYHGKQISDLYRIFYYDCLPMNKKGISSVSAKGSRFFKNRPAYMDAHFYRVSKAKKEIRTATREVGRRTSAISPSRTDNTKVVSRNTLPAGLKRTRFYARCKTKGRRYENRFGYSFSRVQETSRLNYLNIRRQRLCIGSKIGSTRRH